MRNCKVHLRLIHAFLITLAYAGLTLAETPNACLSPKCVLKPLAEKDWDYAKARHLLVRAGIGGTPEEVEKLRAMGLVKAVDHLVEPNSQPDACISFDAKTPAQLETSALETLAAREKHDAFRAAIKDQRAVRQLSREQRQAFSQQRRREDQQQMNQVREWWMKRLVESPRQLEEKLVLFWHGHFATEYRTVRDSYAMYTQNELFRKHAVGNFSDLLHEIVHDAAMLRYLDNNSNVKGRPNENLAREIMELFSMGVGNYTEQDIKQAARALTGYAFDPRNCQFIFRERSHDPDEKTIFGKTDKWNGDQLVDLILEEPVTARFIAGKLFTFFAYENPEEQIIAELAEILRENRYELAPMLKTLFRSQAFYSPKAMGTQIKGPVQLAVGTLRDLGVHAENYAQLVSAVRNMGQDLFDPPNVKGWEGGRNWVNSNRIFVRYNALADLVERLPGPDRQRGIDLLTDLTAKGLEKPEQIVDYLIKSCLIVPLNEPQRNELVKFLGAISTGPQAEQQQRQVAAKLRALLVLMTSLPEYQTT